MICCIAHFITFQIYYHTDGLEFPNQINISICPTFRGILPSQTNYAYCIFLPYFSNKSPPFSFFFVFLVSPYFDHDAFTHHALHVLDGVDAPAYFYSREHRSDI